MFKVLLVDDEPMAIEALKLAADWEKYRFSICGVCQNGEEALKLVEKYHPDLIITDINMPVMDGLQLVKKVINNVDPEVMFVIISGYDDFEYAKSAMQFGIQHYILKPIFKDEFTEVLIQILKKLEKKRELEELCSESIKTDINISFQKFLSGSLSEELLLHSMPSEITCEDAVWAYAALDTAYNWIPENDISNPIEEQYFDDFSRSLDNINLHNSFVYPVFFNTGVNGFILCSTGENTIDDIAQSLIPWLFELYGEGFYLAVGNPVLRIALLKNSMNEAETALNHRFFRPPGNILFHRELNEHSLSYSFNGIHQMEALFDALENLDRERLTSSIKSIFEVFRNTYMAREIVGMYLNNIVYRSFSILCTMGGSSEEMLLVNGIHKQLGSSLTINKMEQIIIKYGIDFCIYAQGLRDKDKQSDMKKVSGYIKENYKRNLTIREISSKLYIHPTYLGHQISKWFGCSFNEYLHKLRMEEAKRLIDTTNLKVHEIATEVGYNSYSNFLEQFVKAFTIKPSEYRKK
jgi:two-component system, response regulator YesN